MRNSPRSLICEAFGCRLNKKLEKASLKRLDYYMNADKDFASFVTTPSSMLPNNYRYLMATAPERSFEWTLYGVIQDIIKGYGETYFIVAGNKVTGFVGYNYDLLLGRDRVYDIVLFSCSDKCNGYTLIKDMKDLLNILKKKYAVIEWCAFQDNPFTKAYDGIVSANGGTRTPFVIQGIRVYKYRLPGTVPFLPIDSNNIPKNVSHSDIFKLQGIIY